MPNRPRPEIPRRRSSRGSRARSPLRATNGQSRPRRRIGRLRAVKSCSRSRWRSQPGSGCSCPSWSSLRTTTDSRMTAPSWVLRMPRMYSPTWGLSRSDCWGCIGCSKARARCHRPSAWASTCSSWDSSSPASARPITTGTRRTRHYLLRRRRACRDRACAGRSKPATPRCHRSPSRAPAIALFLANNSIGTIRAPAKPRATLAMACVAMSP